MRIVFVLFVGLVILAVLLGGCTVSEAPISAPASSPANPAPASSPVTSAPVPSPATSAPVSSPVTSAPKPAPTPTPSLLSGMGTLQVYVTDPPPPEMDEIWVDIKNLNVHRDGGGWKTIDSDPGEFDLKAIEGIQQYLATQVVEAGKYTQIRLEINSVRIVVGKDEYRAKVPSGEIKLVGNFEVKDKATTEITLDFNGKESVNVTGKGDYMFKPVIKLLVKEPGGPSQPLAAPTITSVSPNTGNRGQTLNVVITGTNLTGATAVSFGAGVTVNSFTVNSGTQITAGITIAADAATGARDVSVTAPAGPGTLAGGFTVAAP